MSDDTPKTNAIVQVDPNVMKSATIRANKAFGYNGHLGDSIERRYTEDSFGGILGGGEDYGMFGTNYGYNERYGGLSNSNSKNPFVYMRKYSGSSSVYHNIIAKCMLAYMGNGVVRNVIDLYIDFATQGFRIYHPNKTVENFYKNWVKKVRLNDRILSIFMSLFTTGTVFIHKQYANIDEKQKRILRNSNAKLIGDDFYHCTAKRDRKLDIVAEQEPDVIFKKVMPGVESNKPVSNKKNVANGSRIPWNYTLLNPLQMFPMGNKFTNEHYWGIGLDRQDLKDLSKQYGTSINLAETRVNIPSALKQKLNNRLQEHDASGDSFVAKLKFSKDNLSVVQTRKYDWWDWSIPFVYPALAALDFKRCLRDMETRACKSVINSVFLWKLGDIKNGMPAEKDHFERFADMLQVNADTMNIVWNEAISGDVITADVSKLFDPQKHESADRDILLALGVNESLIGGSGGKFANSFVGATTVLERIESARIGIEEWIVGEFKAIAEAMGFSKLPIVKWGKTNLRDKNAERNLLIQLLDRGVISVDEVLQEFDTSIEIQSSKRQAEKKLIDNGTLKVRGPYIAPMEEANLDPDVPQPQVTEIDVKNLSDDNPKTPNGRPPGQQETNKRKDSNRAPKGQEIARLKASMALEQIQNNVLSKYEQVYGKRYPGLSQQEKDRLEKLSFSIFSHMPVKQPKEIDDDFIVNTLNSGASSGIKAKVLSIYQKYIADYEKDFGKEPSKEHRQRFIVSAWTEAAIDLV